jgi:hypothetical protein
LRLMPYFLSPYALFSVAGSELKKRATLLIRYHVIQKAVCVL